MPDKHDLSSGVHYSVL